jgi:hypothetical protein
MQVVVLVFHESVTPDNATHAVRTPTPKDVPCLKDISAGSGTRQLAGLEPGYAGADLLDKS